MKPSAGKGSPMYQFEKNTMHRIDNFMGRLVRRYYKVIGDLSCTAYVTKEPVRYEDRFTGEKRDLKVGALYRGDSGGESGGKYGSAD